MFPIDNEFYLLYVMYLGYFIFSIQDIFNNKMFRKAKSIVLIIGVILNLMLFLNPDNFKSGGSLTVLFFSFLLLLLLIIIHIVLYIKSKKTK